MKVLLLHPERDVPKPSEAEIPADLLQDIELGVVLRAMAGGDDFVRAVMQSELSCAWQNDRATILHRQDVLRDCLANEAVVRQLYALVLEAFDREKNWLFGVLGRNPATLVSGSVSMLQIYLDILRRIRNTGNAYFAHFTSTGLRGLFQMLDRELDDAYLAATQAELKTMKFRHGVLVSAHLGEGGKGRDYVLREMSERDRSMIRRVLTPGPASYTLQLNPRDEAGARALAELEGGGLRLIADALGESFEHVFGFFKQLRRDLAFYVGCLNLRNALDRVGEHIAFPLPAEGDHGFSCRDLRDLSLALTRGQRVVGNDIDAAGKRLVIVTGANRGGKSTFLRSLGLARIMMQAGLFVSAASFSAPLCNGLFTHYRREEDREMESGKFDEELARMNAIAGKIRPGSVVLFNESFAATNEREGSEVAHQIVSALLDEDVDVLFVTHMFEFAHSFLDRKEKDVLYLRAEPSEEGERSFRLTPGEPPASSHGADLYASIFAD